MVTATFQNPHSDLCDLCCKTTHGPTCFPVKYDGKTFHLTCILLRLFKSHRRTIGGPKQSYRPDDKDKPPPHPGSDFEPHPHKDT